VNVRQRADTLQAVLDEGGLALDELCRLTAVTEQWVTQRVHEGLLPARGRGPASWRFEPPVLRRVRCMVRLERHFDAVPELAALVADLEEEIAALRARLQRG
jgi:chaperone modulatory protein CbpM